MRSRGVSCVLSFVAVAVVVALAAPGPALAAPPPNDFWANAIVMSPLPFTASQDVNEATNEPGEFQFFNCAPFIMQQSVWYKLPASSPQAIVVNANGSDPNVFLNVYVDFGGGMGSMGFVGCTSPNHAPLQFTTQIGGTYYIQAGSPFPGPANLVLNVEQLPPPPNDDFATAKTIDARPFVDPVDLTSATTEPGEPTLPSQAWTPIVASAWYAFTPDVTRSVTANYSSCCVSPMLAVYTGSSLGALTELASRSFGQPITIQAVAGTTYYFQLARGSILGGSAQMTFRLDETPPPTVNFGFMPPDPSVFDLVQFFDFTFDPGQIGIESWAWQFGDGTGASGNGVTHRYAADGDYTVQLTVTTFDGRSASGSQVVHVRTHDVAIVKFTAPSTARAGQTKEISAGVRNATIPENVQFQLLKSVPGGSGFQPVGTLTQLVPVMKGGKLVPVTMSYTFSSEDAAVGKVTFQIVAQIVSGRDAIPADNTAISSPPTRVNP
jgi:PKD repeat protein